MLRPTTKLQSKVMTIAMMKLCNGLRRRKKLNKIKPTPITDTNMFFQKNLLISLLKIFIFSRFIIALCIYFSKFNSQDSQSIVDILTTHWDSVYFIEQATNGHFPSHSPAKFPHWPSRASVRGCKCSMCRIRGLCHVCRC